MKTSEILFGRNLFDNPTFDIDQRLAYASLVGASGFAVDRWYANISGGSQVDKVVDANLIGRAKRGLGIVENTGGAFIRQRMEAWKSRLLVGETLTLDFGMYDINDAGSQIDVYASYPTAEDNWASQADGDAVLDLKANDGTNLNGSFKRFTTQLDLSNANFANGLEIRIEVDGVVSLRFYEPMLNIGRDKTDFYSSFNLHKEWYKAYYYAWVPAYFGGDYHVPIDYYGANDINIPVPFKRRMRVSPTLYGSAIETTDWSINELNNGISTTGFSLSFHPSHNPNMGRITLTKAGHGLSGGMIFKFLTTNIGFQAEL